MCGIFGLIYNDVQVSSDSLERASQSIGYRGRDDSGTFRDPHLHLSHTRLSILDIQGGSQPFHSGCGRYVIVYNGEVFNYLELRTELQAQGATFRTQSDTEVLLSGFIHRGEAFFGSVEGMFAAAIWDKKNKVMTLARDPLGKKPLFVWEAPSGLTAFSSTLRSFKSLPGWKSDLDPLAVSEFTRIGFVPPPLAIYRNTRKVLPGSLEVYDVTKRRWAKRTYSWLSFPEYGSRIRSERVAEDTLTQELSRALKVRTRADVPVGLLFSGGVDSGLLGFLGKEQGIQLPLYNIDYESANSRSPERRNARHVAGLLGSTLHEDDFVPEEIFVSLPEAYQHYDEPCSQLPMVYYHQILSRIRQHGIKVVLTGNGADELFFGYVGNERLRARSDILRWFGPYVPPGFGGHQLAMLRRIGWEGLVFSNEQTKVEKHARILGLAEAPNGANGENYYKCLEDELNAAQFRSYMDVALWRKLRHGGACSNYLLPDINGMHAQVEVRSPFLDWGLVNASLHLQDNQKLGSYRSPRKNKKILKKLYSDRVGRDLAYDTKRGMAWNISWNKWIVNEPAIRTLFLEFIGNLSRFDLDPKWFLDHFENYSRAKEYPADGGGQAVTGFMLAVWLIMENDGLGAVEDRMDSIRGFKPRDVYDLA